MPKDILEKTGSVHKKRAVKLWKVIALGVAVLLIILILVPLTALPIFMNRHIDYRGYETEKYPLQGIYDASDYGLTETEIYVETDDGYKLWCSEIAVDHPKAVVIYLSGIVQPSVTYFYGHAKLMQDNGYSSILLDVRSHGQSSGKQIGLGYTEISDVQAVVGYISNCDEYEGVPIILHGASMGGAIALNAFGQIPEIDAVIAMSSYSSFEDEIMDQLDRYHVPGVIQSLEKPIIILALKMIYGGQAVDELKPVMQIQNAHGRPVFLIACTGDVEVPPINTQQLGEACPDANIWIRDSWEHFIVSGCDFSNVAEDSEYCENILGFLEKSIR